MIIFFSLKICWLSQWKPPQLYCLTWKKTISLEITAQKKPLKQLNLKNKALPLFFPFFLGGGAGRGESGHLCSLGLSLSLPSVWKATVVFWVLPRMENPMVLDILCVRKELAQQTFGLWNCSLLDCNLLIAAKVSGSNHSHHSTHLSLFTPHRGLSRSLLLNMQRIDLPIYSVEVSVTELWIIF